MPTPNLGLTQPVINPTYDLWGAAMNNNLSLIDAASILLRGTPVAATAPTLNQVLKFNGTSWVPAAESGSAVDASTTVKGIAKLSVAPASPTNPIAAGDNDPRMADARTPLAHSISGSQHSAGTVAALNALLDVAVVITTDSRLSDARTPTVHSLTGAQHSAGTLAALNALLDVAAVATTDSRLSDGRAPIGTASGDLSGSFPAPTVAKVQGTTVSATAPTTAGETLRYNGTSQWVSSKLASTDLSDTAVLIRTSTSLSGDLSGNLPGAVVAKVNGVAVTGTPTSGQTIVATSGTAATWQTPSGGLSGSGTTGKLAKWTAGTALGDSIITETPGVVTVAGVMNVTSSYAVSGLQIASSNLADGANLIKTTTSLGGDLSGNLPNGTVAKVQGTTVSATAPSVAGQTLRYNGTIWAPAQLASTDLSNSANVILTSTTLGGDLSGTLPNATVAKVNGVSVTGTPTSGQALIATSGTAATWQTPTLASAASALKTTGADVTISSAAPPTTGQVLTATSATAANWQTPTGGGGGAWVTVYDQALVSDSDTITITGLDLDTHKFYKLFFIGKTTGGAGDVHIYFNGDSTDSNYIRQVVSFSGTSVTAVRDSTSTAIVTCDSAGGIAECFIAKPDTTKRTKVIVQSSDGDTANATPVLFHKAIGWSSTANVTQIVLTTSPSAVNMTAGARVILMRPA